MNIPDMPVQVQVDPDEDTEWNDILRKHKIIPEKPPSPTKEIEAALLQAHELAHVNRLEGKDLSELDALEDEEDADFLDSYRQKRLAELSTLQATSVYNQVYHIQKPEYAREVTEESKKAFVFVLLTATSGGNEQSKLAEELWRGMAAAFGDVKFVQIRAGMAIEGYPERNTPTILVYRDGDIRRQIVTLKEIGGERADRGSLEGVLVAVGAVKIGDVRLGKGVVREDGDRQRTVKNGKPGVSEDSDDDWD